MTKNNIGLGLIQWEARAFDGITEFCRRAEDYVRALCAYKPDILLFPEYFTLSLAAGLPGDDRALLKQVAAYSDALRGFFALLAQKYAVNIAAGSMPVVENDALYNVCYFCHRDGRVEAYRKTHLTPFERDRGLCAGDVLQSIDTDCGMLGLLICYDAEFPEAARRLALQGARLLLVPYQTDTVHGHWRVTHCAQARAIENECYVATAGLVGNMPELSLVEFQYAQAGVYTPCDHFFPAGGILAQATPNLPTAIFAELDISLLDRLHREGTVRTLAHRREDLYEC